MTIDYQTVPIGATLVVLDPTGKVVGSFGPYPAGWTVPQLSAAPNKPPTGFYALWIDVSNIINIMDSTGIITKMVVPKNWPASTVPHAVMIGNGNDPVSQIQPGAPGTVLTSNGPDSNPSFQSTYVGSTGAYGDGGDGALNFDGVTTPVAGATLSGTKYTLTRDIYASAMSIATGLTVVVGDPNAGPWRIICQTAITFNGTGNISCDGGAGANTGAGGAGISSGGTLTSQSPDGAAGGTTTGTGGTNRSNSAGGNAGSGGSGASGAGGASGTVTRPAASIGGVHIISLYPHCITGFLGGNAGSASAMHGGASGGGGGGDGASGAGGGAGGCAVIVASRQFILASASGAQIHANGGAGGNATSGTNTGGGGGGGGGWVSVVTSQALPTGMIIQAIGGAGGTGKGTGAAGNAGSAGTTLVTIV